jgi:thiol-disulfide isomerase/thioredoxin
MKKLLALIIICIPAFLIAQNTFTVNIKLSGLGDKKIRVTSQKNTRNVVDTLTPQKPDLVVWTGKIDEPQFARIEVLDTSLNLTIGKAVAIPPALQFLLTAGTTTITGDAKEVYSASVKSKDAETKTYEKLRMADLPITREMWSLQKEQNRKAIAKDTVGNAAIKERLAALRKQNQKLRAQFIDENPKAFASILVLNSMMLLLPADELDRKFNSLDSKYKTSAAAINLQQKIESNKNTAIGKPVIPFTQTGHTGTPVDIAALKGKVLIIDFWGSWCVPCRQSHPELKALYAKYHERGLEIIGVSNESVSLKKSKEEQEKSWRKAIQEDGINWLHVLYDPAVNDLVKSYDIGGYPTKFLIDQNGKFAMKILGNSPQSHDLLVKKLEELLGK